MNARCWPAEPAAACPPAMREQVLQQVGAPGDLGPRPAVLVDGDLVGRVPEPHQAVRALEVHLRSRWTGADRVRGRHHVEAPGGPHSDHRGVVAVDGVGPVQVGLDRLDVLEGAAADGGQSVTTACASALVSTRRSPAGRAGCGGPTTVSGSSSPRSATRARWHRPEPPADTEGVVLQHR